jgi:predicted nucleotidyltransferase
MSVKFGLTETELFTVKKILASIPTVERALIFGSRARGDYSSTSDIDLAVAGNLSSADMAHLRSAFEESSLIYTVDIVHRDHLDSPSLKESILRDGVEVGF